MLKVIIFSIVVAVLATVAAYLVPVCEYLAKAAILAVLVEIGYWIFIKLFKEEKSTEDKEVTEK